MKKKHYIVSMMAVIFLYLLGIGNFHGALQANNQKTQHASTKTVSYTHLLVARWSYHIGIVNIRKS